MIANINILIFMPRVAIFYLVILSLSFTMFAACSCENNAKDVSLLIEKLKSDDPTVRANAAFYLQSVSIDNQEVIPHLAEALEDNYWLVRAEAVVALGNRCNDSNCANLISNVLVNDPNPNVREACAKVLMNIGKGAKCATPNIIIALKDDDPWVVGFRPQHLEKSDRMKMLLKPLLIYWKALINMRVSIII